MPNETVATLFFGLALAAPGWGQTPGPAAGARGRPFVLGVVDTLRSAELQKVRVLNIYLPAGYQAADTAKYPAVYSLDGSADEDFMHVAGLAQFAAFPWVKALPRSIAVGLANAGRRRDFTFPTTVARDE